MKKNVNLHNTHIHIYLYIKHDIFFIIYGLYLVYFHCTCIYPNKPFVLQTYTYIQECIFDYMYFIPYMCFMNYNLCICMFVYFPRFLNKNSDW